MTAATPISEPPLSAETLAVAAHRQRSLFFLSLAVGAVGFAMAFQMGLASNFVAQTMHATGLQQGLLESSRESCGITALAVLALLAGMAEPLIGALMLLLLGAGLAALWWVPDFTWLVIMSVVWCQGLHVWMPLPNSMTMALAEPGQTGRRLGQMSAAGAIGTAAGLIVAWGLTRWGVPIRTLWLVSGSAAMVGVGACLAIPRQIRAPRQRILFRRKYWLYYALCFLEGWRKQIFVAFAGFLLVRVYGAKLETMLLLWLAAQSLGWLLSPLVGRWIDRVGERPVLMAYYAVMVLVFLGYVAVQDRRILYGLYIADSAFFVLGMALTSYVGRIAPKAEYTPTLSMGVAMNHVAAVTMPLVGGLLWRDTQRGYVWTFAIGAAAAAASIVVAWLVPEKGELVPMTHDEGRMTSGETGGGAV